MLKHNYVNLMDRVNISGASEERIAAKCKVYWKTTYRLRSHKVLRLCTCLAAFVLMVCAIMSLTGKDQLSPFVLTAYASDDGIVSKTIMTENTSIPVSTFETQSGVNGYVFSYNRKDNSETPVITIVSAGDNEEQIDEIVGIKTDPTQNYFFFIPGTTESPCIADLFISDEKNNIVYKYTVIIKKVYDDSTLAELTSITATSRVRK